MNIIKHGKNKTNLSDISNKVKTLKCDKCGAVFEVNISDIKSYIYDNMFDDVMYEIENAQNYKCDYLSEKIYTILMNGFKSVEDIDFNDANLSVEFKRNSRGGFVMSFDGKTDNRVLYDDASGTYYDDIVFGNKVSMVSTCNVYVPKYPEIVMWVCNKHKYYSAHVVNRFLKDSSDTYITCPDCGNIVKVSNDNKSVYQDFIQNMVYCFSCENESNSKQRDYELECECLLPEKRVIIDNVAALKPEHVLEYAEYLKSQGTEESKKELNSIQKYIEEANNYGTCTRHS